MSCLRSTGFAAVLVALCGLTVSAASTKPKKVRQVISRVLSDEQFVPGTRVSLRVVTRGITGLLDSAPLPKARVTLSMRDQKGKRNRVLYRGTSDRDGVTLASFQVPDWPEGAYQMQVETRAAGRSSRETHPVTLKRTGKILLVTDKPIYQPGQLIHMRVLALNAYDLKPLAREKVRFVVSDPKGNKVFKKHLVTSAYGVAATDFQLADEINLGNYQVEVGTEVEELATPALKTLVVKKYVLPKFKVEVDTSKAWYLPKETIKGKIQSDYFFGKPVAGSEVELKASTFDVAFREFASLKGQTDENGTWEFELKLPDYFVGQPLQKGDAVVKLDIKVTDTAKHAEKSVKSIPVAATPIRLDAVPEGGRIVAGVQNQIYLVATYPDGSPAEATVVVKRDGQEVGTVKTDSTGLAVLPVTPLGADMRYDAATPHGSFGQDRGRFDRRRHPRGPQPTPSVQANRVLNLQFEARDAKGASCQVTKSFSTNPVGDRVLLRTDKAIYKSGDTLQATVLTTAGKGTCFVDIVKNRQTVLTRSVPVAKGKGSLAVPLGNDLFGTLELHAYQILNSGEIMRDARVLYVQPRRQLRIDVKPDKEVYRPGEQALIKFKVLDTRGRAATAALGVIIVDEAVYALQEIKPGLEKVYFTLEKELSNPKYQIEFGPSANLATLIKAERVQRQKQQVAKVLLAKARPMGNPASWPNPVDAWVQNTRQKAQRDQGPIQNALYTWVRTNPAGRLTRSGKWLYRNKLIQEMVKGKVLSEKHARNPFGDYYTSQDVEALWPHLKAQALLPPQQHERFRALRIALQNELAKRTHNFAKVSFDQLEAKAKKSVASLLAGGHSPERDVAGRPFLWKRLRTLPSFRTADLAAEVNAYRAQMLYQGLSKYGEQAKPWSGWMPGRMDKQTHAFVLPDNVIDRLVVLKFVEAGQTRDIWGRPFLLKKRKDPRNQIYFDYRLRYYEIVSTGPDGKEGTADDLSFAYPQLDTGCEELAAAFASPNVYCNLRVQPAVKGYPPRPAPEPRRYSHKSMARMEETREMAVPTAGAAMQAEPEATMKMAKTEDTGGAAPGGQPAAPKKRKVRVREFFPETLLFAPLLKTTNTGDASVKLTMADSITTWRLTASANANQGGLGSVSHPIRVFQDFFVDLDLPVALTQNDEVSIPVVVYNYLKTKQRVRLELERGDWFELQGGTVQEMQLEPNEVTSTYYRIKVKGLGRKTLQVRADGSNMSDAIRREIEIRPDGQEALVAFNGRLEGTVTQTVDIPASAVPGASKILVRMYPGVFSQIVEGMESLLRLPGG